MKTTPSNNTDDPLFPSACLPPVLKNVVEETAASLGLPLVMPAAAALSVISASLGKGLRIRSGGRRYTYGNLFMLVSAESGVGKSSVLREMLEPLRYLEAYLSEFSPTFGVRQGTEGDEFEDLKELQGARMKDSPDAPPAPKRMRRGPKRGDRPHRRLICEDTTGPALAVLLAENRETILNVSAEAGNLMDEAGRVGSPLGQILLKGFSGDPIDISRITRGHNRLDEPCVSVLWICQPPRLDDFLARDRLLEDGLIARFLVVHSEAHMLPIGDNVTEVGIRVKDHHGAVVSDLFQTFHHSKGGPLTVEVDPASSEVLKDFHNESVRRWHDVNPALRPCVARWSEQAWKIALVLHAAEHGGQAHKHLLSEATARSAIEIVKWFVHQQLTILGGSGKIRSVRLFDRLVALLEAAPDGEMTVRDLKNSHGFDEDGIAELLKMHGQHIKKAKLQNPKGGRPSSVISLNRESGAL